jgi:hypothetical protein
VLAALSLATQTAWADRAEDKQTCIAAYEKAQHLRNDAKLRAAREQLLVCSRPECPALVRQDCSQWMTEVNAALPSVVIAGRDTQGHDVLAVRVSIDGAVVVEQLDGKPINVDPGVHKFRYETSGMPAVDEQVLVREGERNRPLTVTFTSPNATKPDPIKPPGDDGGADKPSSPVLPVVLIGVGVVALGAALFFDLKANGDARTLRDVCAPNCRQDDVDGVQTKYVAAGVSLGIGIVGVGVGTALFLLRGSGSASTKTQASTWTFDVKPTPGGGAAAIGVRF